LATQRGDHSILLAAYHAGAQPSTAARKLLVASSLPILGEPVTSVLEDANLIAPTPFTINMAHRRNAGVQALSIISIEKTNATVPELSDENKLRIEVEAYQKPHTARHTHKHTHTHTRARANK